MDHNCFLKFDKGKEALSDTAFWKNKGLHSYFATLARKPSPGFDQGLYGWQLSFTAQQKYNEQSMDLFCVFIDLTKLCTLSTGQYFSPPVKY